MSPTVLTVLSVVISIIFIFIKIIKFAVNLDKKKNNKKIIYRCDGCGGVISGKFIRVNESHLPKPLDYCNEKCKSENFVSLEKNYRK